MEELGGYISEDNKSGSSGEPIDEKASNWRFFDRMSFLKNFIGGRK